MGQKNEKPKSFTFIEKLAKWRANRAENKAIKRQIKGLEKDMKGSVSSFQTTMDIWNSQKLPCGMRFNFDKAMIAEPIVDPRANRKYKIFCTCGNPHLIEVDSNNMVQSVKNL